VNAYIVLKDHHNVLKGLIRKVSSTPPAAPERQQYLDDLLVELDIHFRIEDDLYYPALSAAGSLIAVAHAEHRQVSDQLSVGDKMATRIEDLRGSTAHKLGVKGRKAVLRAL
jgi:hypothetical protein